MLHNKQFYKSIRLPYLLDLDTQLQHNGPGENSGEELEGREDGELPSQQHNLETTTTTNTLEKERDSQENHYGLQSTLE